MAIANILGNQNQIFGSRTPLLPRPSLSEHGNRCPFYLQLYYVQAFFVQLSVNASRAFRLSNMATKGQPQGLPLPEDTHCDRLRRTIERPCERQGNRIWNQPWSDRDVEYGKTIRRSHDGSNGKSEIHMVNAWASANHLLLGQTRVDARSNEITTIPELLRALDVRGCIVTIKWASRRRGRGPDGT